MTAPSIPPLPGSQESQNEQTPSSGGVLGMLAACSGGASVFAVAASVFLLFQEDATMSAAALVMGGLAMFAALIALVMGFVVVVSVQAHSRSSAVVAMISGTVTLVAVLVVGVTGLFHSAQRKFELTDDGIEHQLPPVEPLVIKQGSRTDRDNKKLWRRWFIQNLEQPMKTRLAGKAWEKEGLQAVKAFPSAWVNDWGQLSKLEWQTIGAGLVRKKCDDPLLLYLVSRSCDMGLNQFNILRNAAKEITVSEELNPLWALMAYLDVAQKVEYGDDEEDRRPTDAEVLRRLKRACEAGCFDGEQVWLLDHLLAMYDGKKFTKRHAFEIAEVFEKSGMPEWMVHWMRGYGELREAWKVRGSGSSSKTTAVGRKGFQDHSDLARKELVKSWELAPQYPFASALMIRVSMGSSENSLKEMRMWLDRSNDAHVGNWTAITNYNFGIYPRWHGSHDMMFEFADRCMDSKRYDTYLPWMQMIVMQHMAGESSDKEQYYQDEEVYDKLMQMLEGYLADADKDTSAESINRKRAYWTYQVVISRRAGHDEKLPELWEKLQGKFHQRALATWKVDREDLEFRSILGQQDQHLHNAENYMDQDLFDEAIAEYEAILSQSKPAEPQQQALRKRIALLKLKKQWQAGQWVTLWPVSSPDPDLWRVVEGKRLADANGYLKFQSDAYRYVVDHPLTLGMNYEIEAKVGPAAGVWGTPGFGIWMSKRPWNGTHWEGLKMRRAGNKQLSVEVGRWRYTPDWSAKIKDQESVLLNLKCQGKFWTVSADGRKLNAKDIEVGTHNSGDNTRMALGGFVRPEWGTTVSYQSIRVRKLEPREE
ncbi:MAG: hypothetical protein QM496_02290 [Verrucomicrobiota bacterium]